MKSHLSHSNPPERSRFHLDPFLPRRERILVSLSSLVLAFGVLLLLSACSPREGTSGGTHANHSATTEPGEQAGAEESTRFVCSMHPSIVSDQPGKCPICAMDLQPVKTSGYQGIPGRETVQLDAWQRQLINVRTTRVVKEPAKKKLRMVGILKHDASKVFTVAAWTSGRIEELIVDQPELNVQKGDPLYRIYSPELYSSLQEYVTFRERSGPNARLLEAARTRLRLLGLSDFQIDELTREGRVDPTITVHSPISGKVMAKMVNQGDYVKTGSSLYMIVDLSKLWLVLTVYEPEFRFVSPGQKVVATSQAYPNTTFPGTVDAIYHHVNEKTRTAEVRVVFNQPEQLMLVKEGSDGSMNYRHRLLPDMFMNASLEVELGTQLLVPKSAVFDTGTRRYVYVEMEPGVFVPLLVQLGTQTETHYVVESGLSEGTKVVVDGNFLIDSESQFRASGAGAVGGHQHGDGSGSTSQMEGPDSADPPGSPSGHESHDEKFSGPVQPFPDSLLPKLNRILDQYFKAREALAADDFEPVPQILKEMQGSTRTLLESKTAAESEMFQESLTQLIHVLEKDPPEDLEAARNRFGHLSEVLIAWLKNFPPDANQVLHVAYCPMWKSSPNHWIQRGEEIKNPFMGERMLRCGSINQILPAELP